MPQAQTNMKNLAEKELRRIQKIATRLMAVIMVAIERFALMRQLKKFVNTTDGDFRHETKCLLLALIQQVKVLQGFNFVIIPQAIQMLNVRLV